MLVSCAGLSLHQFRAYTSSVCSIHSQGRHGNQGCGAKKQRWRSQEDSAAKESCVTLHEPRARRRREINDVLQQTSFNGAIFFPTTCITPYAMCATLAIYSHHTCRSQKAQTPIHQPAFGKKSLIAPICIQYE
jgi:hypothetical protein